MLTQTAKREELLEAINALPDDGVIAALDFVRGLQSNAMEEQDDDFYNPTNIQWIKDSIAQMAQGKIVVKTIKELENMADG